MVSFRRIIQRLSFALLVYLLAAAPSPAEFPPIKTSQAQGAASAQAALLQFSAGGHVIGFEPCGLYVASGSHALRISFQGANPATPSASQDKTTPGAAANNTPVSMPSVRALAKVTWRNLWDGITLSYQTANGAIAESIYTLAPGADVTRIRLAYNVPVRLNGDGSLTLAFQTGQMTESAPTAWQEIHGQRVPVKAAFSLNQANSGDTQIGYTLGQHDPTYDVTIDPLLKWTTFMGSVDNDTCKGITIDSLGNIYIVGESWVSWGSPTRLYQYDSDAYVAKISPTGTLVWNTFLGGQTGDLGNGIAYSAYDGSIYVVGTSSSTWGSPTAQNIHKGSNDAYVARLAAADGALVWNSFLGNNGNDYGQAITVDGTNGWILAAGISYASWGSPARPYTSGEDTFVTRLYSTGDVSMVTFLGGFGGDEPVAIATDNFARAYVTGFSNAAWGTAPVRDFTAGRDAYVARVNFDGTLIFNTFLGGADDDQGVAITVDSNYNTIVVGNSYAAWGTQPVQAFTGSEDVFAAKLAPNGGLTWFTFFGGSGYSTGSGVTLDSNGYIYVSGTSDSTWGPGPVHAYTDKYDMFAARLDSSGQLQWNTFMGGNEYDNTSGIVINSSGYIYLSGASSASWGTATTYTGGSDGAAVKLNPNGSLIWNTFVGGGGDDIGTAVTIDSLGNIIVVGSSDMRWPTSNYGPGQPIRDYSYNEDAFVAKLSPSGTLLWHTFLGGAQNDYAKAVTVDSNNFIYVAGISSGSWGNPIQPISIGVDGFAAELNPGGVLQWNTFLGGNGTDVATGIARDTTGNIYVSGTSSQNWGSPARAYSGGYDGYLAHLNANGILQWNSFVGGAGNDYIDAIAVLTPDIYLGGESFAAWGSPVNAYSAGEDGVVADFNSSGGMVWNTFLGGTGFDNVAAITVDSNDNIYAAGSSTASWGLPIRAYSGNSDIFAAQVTYNGEVAWNTFLGGAGYDYGIGIAVHDKNLFITGISTATWGTPSAAYTANDDTIVAQLSAEKLVRNTFLGGSGYDDGNGIASVPNGSLAVVGSSDQAWGTAAPGFNGGMDAFVTTFQTNPNVFLPIMIK